jgi:hypothetical protein
MHRLRCLTNAVLLAAATLTHTAALADGAILKGLPHNALSVRFEALDPDARKAGLSESSLAKVIQGRLQRRGLAGQGGGDAEIYGRVVVLTSYSVTNEVLGYGAHVELSLREKALLKRDRATEFMAPVWFKGNVTVANPKQIVAQVVHALAELTDQLLNDYLAQNPR